MGITHSSKPKQRLAGSKMPLIVEILYNASNASNKELIRTQTLVKNCIVSVDPTPFKYYWYIHILKL